MVALLETLTPIGTQLATDARLFAYQAIGFCEATFDPTLRPLRLMKVVSERIYLLSETNTLP
jgi:hypothetical protein